MNIKFNEERAFRVFNILNTLWREKADIFKGVVLPQDRYIKPMPPEETANFFFFGSLPMRGGVISESPFKWLAEMYEINPDVFNPRMVVNDFTPEEIVEMMRLATRSIDNGSRGEKEAGPLGYKLEQHSKNWYDNSVKLVKFWGDDIRNVFWGVVDFEEAFRRIDYRRQPLVGLKGMRRKIFSLLTIWLQEKNLIPYFPTPIPIDFHVLRIIWACEIIRLRGIKKPEKFLKLYGQIAEYPAIRIKESFVDEIAKWSQDFLSREGLSHLNINPAIWVLSRDLCSSHFQNMVKEKRGKVFVLPEKLRNYPDIWPKDYKDPCLLCPIKKYCTGIVPWNPYYRDGILARLPRIPYPKSPLLPGIDWTDFLSYKGKRRSLKPPK